MKLHVSDLAGNVLKFNFEPLNQSKDYADRPWLPTT
jgi:hypothetical protein